MEYFKNCSQREKKITIHRKGGSVGDAEEKESIR
jgi:hypothetical protein